MKKMALVFIFGLLVYSQAFAQAQPIMGYDTVPWGASVLDVRKAFNLGNRFVLQERYENNQDVAALVQKNVSDSIKERIFMFNKWKGQYQLYRVWVIYFNDSTVQNLQTALTNRFGERTDSKRDREMLFPDGYDVEYLNTNTTVYGKHSPELLVELVHEYETREGILGGDSRRVGTGSLRVCYTWKKFRDEYQSRNVQF